MAFVGSEHATVLQLKITLLNSKPKIWRRILVPSNYTYYRLHDAIQESMGWRNQNRWYFVVNGVYVCRVPDPDYSSPTVSAKIITLLSLQGFSNGGDKALYEYDFSNGWEHEVLLEAVFSVQSDSIKAFPKCLDGEGLCPPEDCGGIYRFRELMEILNDSDHPEYRQKTEWLHRNFYNARSFIMNNFDRRQVIFNGAWKEFLRC